MATFFSDVIMKVDRLADSFVLAKTQAVMSSISNVSTSLFIIYVMLWAIAMMRGSIEEPVFDAALRMTKIAVILALALSIGNYQQYIYEFLWKSPDAMAKVIVGSGYSSQTNVLDSIYEAGMKIGDRSWDEMGLASGIGGSIGYAAIAGVSYIAAYLLTGYAACLIVMSKIAMAILLAVGPIFLLLIMFNATQKFFESWLGVTINFIFITIMVAAVIAFIQQLLGNFLNDVLASETITMRDAGELFMLGIIAVVVLKQIPTIASSLGGGAALSTLGVVQAALDKTKGQFRKQARYGRNPQTGRRDQVSYRSNAGIVGSATMKAAAAPAKIARNLYKNSRRNTVANQ